MTNEEYIFISSEIRELESLLADVPKESVINRWSLEKRLQSARALMVKNLPGHAVCNYALLRFLPYRETGEFVNVGVLVVCLQPVTLEFHMDAPRTFPRVKAFFPGLKQETFAAGHAAVAGEFERVRTMIKQARERQTAQRAFQELVRPRELIFQFGEVRTISTSNPDNVAEELFNRYIDHGRARKEQTTVALKN